MANGFGYPTLGSRCPWWPPGPFLLASFLPSNISGVVAILRIEAILTNGIKGS